MVTGAPFGAVRLASRRDMDGDHWNIPPQHMPRQACAIPWRVWLSNEAKLILDQSRKVGPQLFGDLKGAVSKASINQMCEDHLGLYRPAGFASVFQRFWADFNFKTEHDACKAWSEWLVSDNGSR